MGTMQEVEEVEGRGAAEGVGAVEASMTQMTREAWEAFCQARSMPRFSMASVVVRRPAVSMKRYVTPPMVAVSSMVSRVVPGMSLTMARSSPTRRLRMEDLPALGLPMMATGMPFLMALPVEKV